MGYKTDIMVACRRLGKNRGTFDYRDVMKELPHNPYRPTDRQVIRIMSIATYLVPLEKRRKDDLTRYAFKHPSINVSGAMKRRGKRAE